MGDNRIPLRASEIKMANKRPIGRPSTRWKVMEYLKRLWKELDMYERVLSGGERRMDKALSYDDPFRWKHQWMMLMN